jgi:hypothetical protein
MLHYKREEKLEGAEQEIVSYSTQRKQFPNLNYLLTLIRWDLDSSLVISEMMKPQVETKEGENFLKFILDKAPHFALK